MNDSELTEALIDFTNALESLAVNLRRQIQASTRAEAKATVSEERFHILKWENEKGERLGDFEVAYQKNNLPEAWSHAFNVLKANAALIAAPFKEEGYQHRYWIYPEKYLDRIFRKKLGEAKG